MLSRNNPTKFEMTRFVLNQLNSREDNSALRQRREILKRVYEFESFEQCWDNDRLIAKGLVAEIQKVTDKKDAFTRMNMERETERQQPLAENNRKIAEQQKRQKNLDDIKKSFFALFNIENPQERGKQLEKSLNDLFKVFGISIKDAFTLCGQFGQGIIEQIDGVIEIDGEIYIVEMKWLKDPLGKAEMSEHLVRIFNRGGARGLIISASGFSKPAYETAKEALAHKVIILVHLREIVDILEELGDLKELLKQKVRSAITEKNPYYNMSDKFL